MEIYPRLTIKYLNLIGKISLMDNSDSNYQALSLASESKEALLSLIVSLNQCDLLQMCYAYKSRVKPEKKLVEKVHRKQGDGKPEYKLTDITDVIGLRFVTLFRKEMPEILFLLIQIIKHQKQLTPNPFKESHFEEIIIYTTDMHDEITLVIKNILEKEDISIIKNNGLKVEEKKDTQVYI